MKAKGCISTELSAIIEMEVCQGFNVNRRYFLGASNQMKNQLLKSCVQLLASTPFN